MWMSSGGKRRLLQRLGDTVVLRECCCDRLDRIAQHDVVDDVLDDIERP